jgi:hypothetical protein
MFILDDIILKELGIEFPGISLLWTMEELRDFALKELYNPEKIREQIKENRLLLELGEVSPEEYERTNAALLRKLQLAQRSEEMNIRVRSDILGTG